MILPNPVKLKDLGTNKCFKFAHETSFLDVTRLFRKVICPNPAYVDKDGFWGVSYQPKDDGNSCHIVNLLTGVLYRAQSSILVVEVPVEMTVKVA